MPNQVRIWFTRDYQKLLFEFVMKNKGLFINMILISFIIVDDIADSVVILVDIVGFVEDILAAGEGVVGYNFVDSFD